MTHPKHDPSSPPPTVAPVIERTSAAAAAAIPAAASVPAEPTPTLLPPVVTVAVPEAPLVLTDALATPSPLPPDFPVSAPSSSVAVSGGAGVETEWIPVTPDVAPVNIEEPVPEVQVEPEAILEPEADPIDDVNSVDVINTIKIIEAGTNPNVTQEFIVEKKDSRGGPEKLETPNIQQIVFPDLITSSLMNNLEHPAASRQDDLASRRWAQILQASTSIIPTAEMFQDIPAREGADFRQYLKTERNRVGYSAPTFNDVAGTKLTGERAIQRVRALMGQGGLIMVPLWHSGFHVTLKTPSESALIEVRRRMENERISLGRYTFGMAFSNTASYTVNIMMDLILEHVYETSLKDQTDLRNKIEALDIPVLMWGMACAVWPNGFQYARALTSEAGILQNQIMTGLIDVAKLMWVDNKAFTSKQKAHMSNRQTGMMTNEQVAGYKDDFPLRAGRLVELAPGISVEFAPPSVEAYIASGRRWVEKLVGIVEGTITNDREDIEGRNRAIIQHGNATYMRQLGHWVKQISLGDDIVADEENIEAVLETLSEREDIRIAYVEGYRKYVNDITTAIIAIPEAAQNDLTVPRFPNLIPIDVISTFFTLLMQRVNQLINR